MRRQPKPAVALPGVLGWSWKARLARKSSPPTTIWRRRERRDCNLDRDKIAAAAQRGRVNRRRRGSKNLNHLTTCGTIKRVELLTRPPAGSNGLGGGTSKSLS